MKEDKKWYIVYTHAGKQTKTLKTLTKKHIVCFCPLGAPAAKAKSNTAATPLLPSYIFVHISPEEEVLVRQADGVVNFMYWLNECVVVEDEDMVTLQELTQKYEVIGSEKIKVNKQLSATKTWKSLPAIPGSNDDEEREIVTVSFPSYGFSLTAKEIKVNVRIINIRTNRSELAAGVQFSR